MWETDTMDLLSEHSEPFSATWPSSGMTRSGVAFELPTPVLPTAGTGSSSSRFLPTPLASDDRSSSPADEARHTPQLRSVLLKTPTAQLAVNGGSQHPEKRREGGHGPTLADEVEHLLPTPSAAVVNDGEDTGSWLARRARVKATGVNGNGMGMPLTIAAQLLASGDPSDPPSSAGSASPDE
ncbi:hypothetical protein [Curtobacterium sp. 'Ferrero']|uniref:hypothetical protein n=1 Tax=Curtobacterium sp. 'Ferrero' TaxID=2033654 RepID=UPI0020D10C89|nr:hypothetical protein [Curtobacterium sp. 'Ferrero']